MKVCVIGLLLLFPISGYAGPPFQSDDPDPIDYQHFEACLFALSDSAPSGGTNLEGPSFEMNWGAAPNLHLHFVLPLVSSFAPGGSPDNFGIGDIELGAKYRFIKEGTFTPEVGVFPFVELPTGDGSC